MSKGTTAAERLGHPRRCSARRKRTGEPCGAWAIKGGNVCRIHGGMAPQTQAKAKQRLDLEVVRDAVRRLRGHEPVPSVQLPGDPPEVDTPATEPTPEPTPEPPSPALVDPVSQPDPPAEAPEPEPPKQIDVPLMGLTEAMALAGRGNRQARVVRPRMRRR